MEKELHIVGFRVGRETYGVPIKLILEIVRVPEITAVPDAPDHIEGVINLRGKIVSIIDLRKRFREKQITHSRHNRILIMELGGRLAGLVVDGASEVMKIPATDIEPPPAGFQDSGLQCVTGVAKYGGRLVVLLDITKLLQREVQGLQAAIKAESEPEPAAKSMAAKAKG
jgi:purine-binding chemotaxis protein CheW